MGDRCQQDSHRAKKNDAAKEGIKAGENLAAIRMQISQRPHAGQNHGGIGKRIHPIHAFEEMITHHANAESDDDNSQAPKKRVPHPAKEGPARQERAGAMFEHGGILARRAGMQKPFYLLLFGHAKAAARIL